MTQYVGLDVHKQTCHATVMDDQGNLLKQEKFRNERREFQRIFESMIMAMEASSCWQPAYELLENMGYEVKLAHPVKTRLIAEALAPLASSEPASHLVRANRNG